MTEQDEKSECEGPQHEQEEERPLPAPELPLPPLGPRSRASLTPSTSQSPAAPRSTPTADAAEELRREPRRSDSAPVTESRLMLFDREGLAPGFFAVLFIGCGLSLVYVIKDFVADLVIAFILVGIFGGIYERVKGGLGGRRWLASGIVTTLMLVVLLVPLSALAYTIVHDAAKAYDSLVEAVMATGGPAGLGVWLDEGVARLGVQFSQKDLQSLMLEAAQGIRALAMSWGSALVSNTLTAVIDFTIIIVLVFYLLVDGERLKIFAFELSPLPDDEDALIVDTFKKVAKGVVIGNGVGSALQGLLGGLAMSVVGISSPVLWGAVMAVFAFLPLVGISIVVIPASIVLAVQERYVAAVTFFSFCTLQGLVIENLIKTRLIGSQMRMHDLLVFLSILGGIATFGIVGLVYGPLIAMLFMTLSDLYSHRYRPRLARRYARSHATRDSLPPSSRIGG